MTDEAKLYERIAAELEGIDLTEDSSPDSIGWWETDSGMEFGIAILHKVKVVCIDFEQRLQAAQTRVAELERNNALMAEQLISGKA